MSVVLYILFIRYRKLYYLYELTHHWPSVQKWLSRRRYSNDEIRIGADFDRSIKGINFKLHEAKKGYIEAASDWIVKTDIARFYPSIYTHSIPWAAYGKEKVKSNRRAYEGSLADRLDLLVRRCNRNQTIGIPIGPETSRIIAEVISSSVDHQFSSHPDADWKKIDRLQDDWFVGAASFEEAETALSRIGYVYREFGLDINGSKTSVAHVKSPRNAEWIGELEAFIAHRTGPLSGGRLKEFFSLAVRLQSQSGQEAPIKYALTALESIGWNDDDISVVVSFLVKSANIAPGALESIARILINQRHVNSGLSVARIVDRFSQLAVKNFQRGHQYEVIWLLYAIRGLKRAVLLKPICEMLEGLASSTIPLLLLDMHEKGILLSKLPKSYWEKQITENNIKSDWSWLLAYEGIRHGWLKDTYGLMGSPLFEPLAKRNVAFYNPARNIITSRAHLKALRMSGRRDTNAARRLLMQLRGLFSTIYWVR